VLAEQFEPGADQSSTAIRNAFICGLTRRGPSLAHSLGGRGRRIVRHGNQLSNRINVGADTI
jgi:hypothetical protein